MTLEQITFRINIDGPHESTFVHFIDTDQRGCLSVKIGDLVMSIDEFRSYVEQLKWIESNLLFISEFAKNVDA